MPKGKATNPVRVLCHPEMLEWESIQELMAKGHEFVPDPGMLEYDFVMGPTCMRVLEEHKALMDIAFKGAQAIATVRHKERRAAEKEAAAAERKRKKEEREAAKALRESAKKTPEDHYRAELFGEGA